MNKHAETLIKQEEKSYRLRSLQGDNNEWNACKMCCKTNEKCTLDFSFLIRCYRNFVCSVICSRCINNDFWNKQTHCDRLKDAWETWTKMQRQRQRSFVINLVQLRSSQITNYFVKIPVKILIYTVISTSHVRNLTVLISVTFSMKSWLAALSKLHTSSLL